MKMPYSRALEEAKQKRADCIIKGLRRETDINREKKPWRKASEFRVLKGLTARFIMTFDRQWRLLLPMRMEKVSGCHL
jgi:hypothetical protein